MESVLAKTKECQEVSLLCGQVSSSDPAPSLLLLYQLEAQLHLGIMNPENGLMDQILSLPRAEPKLYESVAGQKQYLYNVHVKCIILRMYMYYTCQHFSFDIGEILNKSLFTKINSSPIHVNHLV